MELDLVDKAFLGIVLNNDDPKRLGRIKVRVIDVFDNITEDAIPWASPNKDLAGQEFSIPSVSKIVSVEFENGHIYTPVYTYAQNFNINLEKKLQSLPYDDYQSMTAMQFDDVTQVYVNNTEGLKLDHKFNMINVTKDGINLNLKDNTGTLNLGSYDANQQAILGTNFMIWFKHLVAILRGDLGGAYLGNLGAPTITSPSLIEHLLKFDTEVDLKFLSHNINLNDNGYVNQLSRININQTGDKWTSTVDTNSITQTNLPDFTTTNVLKTETPDGQLTTEEGSIITNIKTPEMPAIGETHPDTNFILGVLKDKKYNIFSRPYELNIVGVRDSFVGQPYTNKFTDKLYAMWKDDNGQWQIKYWKFSTMPGSQRKVVDEDIQKGVPKELLGQKISMKKWCSYIRKQGIAILAPAQYVNSFIIGEHAGDRALKSINKQTIYRDKAFDSDLIVFSTGLLTENVGIHIHRGYQGGIFVSNWSEGCQIFSSSTDLNNFFNLCDKHQSRYGNNFSYTLITSKDVDNWKRKNLS